MNLWGEMVIFLFLHQPLASFRDIGLLEPHSSLLGGQAWG